MENVKSSPAIYETFVPFNLVLNICGFWYIGVNVNRGRENLRFILSIVYSLSFLLLFVMNVRLGEQEPESTTSLLLKHGWHKLYLIEFFILPFIIWNNFYYRKEISRCLHLISLYDVMCEVCYLSLYLFYVVGEREKEISLKSVC
jgi:hypothetical protein